MGDHNGGNKEQERVGRLVENQKGQSGAEGRQQDPVNRFRTGRFSAVGNCIPEHQRAGRDHQHAQGIGHGPANCPFDPTASAFEQDEAGNAARCDGRDQAGGKHEPREAGYIRHVRPYTAPVTGQVNGQDDLDRIGNGESGGNARCIANGKVGSEVAEEAACKNDLVQPRPCSQEICDRQRIGYPDRGNTTGVAGQLDAQVGEQAERQEDRGRDQEHTRHADSREGTLRKIWCERCHFWSCSPPSGRGASSRSVERGGRLPRCCGYGR